MSTCVICRNYLYYDQVLWLEKMISLQSFKNSHHLTVLYRTAYEKSLVIRMRQKYLRLDSSCKDLGEDISVVFFSSHWNIYTEHHSHGILCCDCSKRVLSSDMTTFDLKKIPIHLFLRPTNAWHGISSGNIKKYSYTAYLHSLHLFNFANEITMFEQTRRTRNKIFVFISIKRQIFDINSLFFFFDSFFSFLLFILCKNIGHTRIINDIKEN